MGPYQGVLAIARAQVQAVARGDFEWVMAALDERAALLDGAPPPVADDIAALKEILHLDRQISSAIRERMIEIRGEVVEGQHGVRALAGYGRRMPRRPAAIDRLS